MTIINISDLMDGLGDEALALTDPGVTSPERILALVRERSGRTSPAPARLPRAKKTRRLGRALLAAAAVAALLGATAYAVYELVIDRYVIDRPFWFESEQEAAENPASRISLVGYQGTPEYLAFAEWEGLQEKWQAEKMAFWQERGADDSYHETPDSYYGFYSAVTQEQADQVDAIMAKYGLTPHTAWAFYSSAAELYDALGTESFYADALAGSSNGYVYDDGTFKDEGRGYVFPDGRQANLTVFVSAKGSFTDISGTLDMTGSWDEWSYTAASGVTVDLVLTSNQGEILAETDGAYTDVSVSAGRTREDLQAIADCIDFAVLAERFDGRPHPETGEKVAAMAQAAAAQEEARQAEAEADAARRETASRDVIARLGAYGITALPEGYKNTLTQGRQERDHRLPWTGMADFDQVTRAYWNQQLDANIDLNVFRFPDTAKAMEDARAYFCGADWPGTQIRGCDGFVTAQEQPGSVIAVWYDPERDVLFLLECARTGLDTDGVLALAESVTEQAYTP